MKRVIVVLLVILLTGQTVFGAELNLSVEEPAVEFVPEGTGQSVFVTGQDTVTFTGAFDGNGTVYFFVGKPYVPYSGFDKLEEGEQAEVNGETFRFVVERLSGRMSPLPVFAVQSTAEGLRFSDVVFVEAYTEPPFARLKNDGIVTVYLEREDAPVTLKEAVVTIGGVPVPFAVLEHARQLQIPIFYPVTEEDMELQVRLSDLAGHSLEFREQVYPLFWTRGDRSIRRDEFAALLSESLGLDTDGTANRFSDRDYIPLEMRKYVYAVSSAGLMLGEGDAFGADGYLTREMAAAIAARALNLQEKNGDETAFTDAETISDWAREAVEAAQQNDIIHGYPDGSFCPLQPMTVEEAAQLVVNMIQANA